MELPTLYDILFAFLLFALFVQNPWHTALIRFCRGLCWPSFGPRHTPQIRFRGGLCWPLFGPLSGSRHTALIRFCRGLCWPSFGPRHTTQIHFRGGLCWPLFGPLSGSRHTVLIRFSRGLCRPLKPPRTTEDNRGQQRTTGTPQRTTRTTQDNRRQQNRTTVKTGFPENIGAPKLPILIADLSAEWTFLWLSCNCTGSEGLFTQPAKDNKGQQEHHRGQQRTTKDNRGQHN